MKPSSAKQKGRLLQQLVAKKLIESFPFFTELDIKSTGMGQNGEDVQLSQAAKNLLQIQIECKSRAAIAVYKDYEQADTHGTHEPVVVIKQNRSKPLALIDLDYFIKILKGYINERI